jgi:malate dehydrogenase
LTPEEFDAAIEGVRNAGDTILQMAQRSTSYYAPSAAIAALVEAVARDTRAILPVSLLLIGEYGLNGIAVSVPASVGARGVDRIIVVEMSGGEKEEFLRSAAELRESLERVSRLAGGESHG